MTPLTPALSQGEKGLHPSSECRTARPVLFLAWQGARAGIERHLATLIHALPPRYERAVAFLSVGGPIADELRAAGIPVHVLGMRRSYDPRGGVRLVRLLRSGGFALVHDHSTMAAAPIAALALTHVPVVVTEHLSFAQRRLDQRVSYRLLSRFVECFIANSQATQADLCAHGIARDKTRVIYPGLPGLAASGAANRAAARAQLGVATTTPLVGFVGRLEPEKGCRDFVRAAAAIRAQVPDARFVIVGDGSQRSNVESDIAAANLTDRVRLTGALAGIETIYPAFDLLLSTSARETFGLAILEAMAAGVPVVAFAVGGVPELVAEGGGVAVAPGDVDALGRVVVQLLSDNERRRALAAAGGRVTARFSAARMAQEVADVYDAVLAKYGLP